MIGAGFTGLYQNPKEVILVQTYPSLTTIEKLQKNDQIWISIGRKNADSSMSTNLQIPALFSVKMIAK